MEPAPKVTVKKIFQFIHKTVTVLVQENSEVAFQLWLSGALVADKMDQLKPGDFEAICYEFYTQGWVCFEEERSDSRAQFAAIHHLVASMGLTTCLEEENYDTISQKVLQHSTKLLKKPMQCRAISCCAQVYWNDACRDPEKVLQCLQKCLKICDAVSGQDPKQVGLWVEMLDRYVYFLERGCEKVETKHISSLSQMAEEHIGYAKGTAESEKEGLKAEAHLTHSRKYIRWLKDTAGERFADIDV
jgi:vacuolar protein sorting-associated protein 35